MSMSTAEIRAIVRDTMPLKMAVYTENPSTAAGGGRFDVLQASGIACRLSSATAVPSSGGQDRAEFLAHRLLSWDPTYALPDEHCQLLVSGPGEGTPPSRWQPIAGSMRALIAPGGVLVMSRKAQVTRVV